MENSSFLIQLIKSEISVYERIDNRLMPLKNRGEERQAYSKDDFWDWWRRKIEYNQEMVSFFVISDQEEFEIPTDIKIAEENGFKDSREVVKLSKGFNLFSFPTFEIDFTESIEEEEVEKEIKEPIQVDPSSLSAYFQNKTNKYRR